MRYLLPAAVAALALPLVASPPAHAAVVGSVGGSMTASAQPGCTLKSFNSMSASKPLNSNGKKVSVSFADTGAAVSSADPKLKSTLKGRWTQSIGFTRARGGLKSLRFSIVGKASVMPTGGPVGSNCESSTVAISGSASATFTVARKGTLTTRLSMPGSGYRTGTFVISGPGTTSVSVVGFTAKSQVTSFKVKPGTYSFSGSLSGQASAQPNAPFEMGTSSFNTTLTVDFKGA